MNIIPQIEAENDRPDWKQVAQDAWAEVSAAQEQARLDAESAAARHVIQELSQLDPPIVATPLRDRAEADGILFGANANGRLVMLRHCDLCGHLIQSHPLKTWADIGACMSVSPTQVAQDPHGDYDFRRIWSRHHHPEPDPADLVSPLRQLLLHVYDRHDGTPLLPLYVIRRAEKALEAFERRDESEAS